MPEISNDLRILHPSMNIKMKRHYSLLAACALLAIMTFTACPPSNAGGTTGTDTTKVDSLPPAPVHDYGAAIINLERSECFGTCPSYLLTLDGSGKVSYLGRNHVAVKGLQTGVVSAEAFKGLVDEFFKADYFALQDSFDSDITDVPHAITSLMIDGKTKRIFDRDGAPAKLRALENQIDVVAGSDKWVKAAEE
jgi:Domain of unknown function (DUF6438)